MVYHFDSVKILPIGYKVVKYNEDNIVDITRLQNTQTKILNRVKLTKLTN